MRESRESFGGGGGGSVTSRSLGELGKQEPVTGLLMKKRKIRTVGGGEKGQRLTEIHLPWNNSWKRIWTSHGPNVISPEGNQP